MSDEYRRGKYVWAEDEAAPAAEVSGFGESGRARGLVQSPAFVRHPAPPPHEQWMHAGIKKLAKGLHKADGSVSVKTKPSAGIKEGRGKTEPKARRSLAERVAGGTEDERRLSGPFSANHVDRSRARQAGLSDAAAAKSLAGWSNGYLTLETTPEMGQPSADGVDSSSVRTLLAAFDRAGKADPSADDIASWARAAGADTHPGDGALKTYWTEGEGLAKWIDEPHRWTALYHHLKKHMPDELAKRTAAQWFRDTLGFWPGEQKGSNPVGPG